jgi:hypothetical protein
MDDRPRRGAPPMTARSPEARLTVLAARLTVLAGRVAAGEAAAVGVGEDVARVAKAWRHIEAAVTRLEDTLAKRGLPAATGQLSPPVAE